jgi:hypothetical protein
MLGLIMALLSAFAILAISRMPSRFLFAVLFGALTFLIFALLQNNVERLVSKPFNLSLRFQFKFSRECFVLLIYAISIFLVLLIPSFSDAQFVNWQSIPATNYIRLLAGLLLSSILPGYGLLRFIDRKRRFDGLASIVFSFFISVFLMALITFATIAANLTISNIFWLSLILNLVILVAYSFTFVKKNKPAMDQENDVRVSHRIDFLIIACIFLFFVIGWIVYYSSYQLGSTGDMWDHYYTVLHVLKGGLFSSSHLSYLNVETWFSLHYIAVFQLIGFPLLNGWMVYAFINFFYVLAFYLMVRGIVGDKYPKIPIIATVIATLFAGFGWIEALRIASNYSYWSDALAVAGNSTYNDIIYSFIYGPIPQYFSLAVLFALIYLLTNKGKFSATCAFLTVVLIAQGLLVHSPEIIFLAIFYFCFIVFCNREDFGRLIKYSLSILLGFFAVFVIGLPFASHFYFNMALILPVLVILICLTFAPIYIRTKNTFHLTFSRRITGIKVTIKTLVFSRKISIFIICLVWFFYVLSYFAWNYTLNLDLTGNLAAVGLKPWYIYPINSGMSLLLGLLGITLLILDKKTGLSNAKFLGLSLLSFFVAGILLSFVNIYFNIANVASTYWEKRLYSFMVIPLSIFGAFFITQVSFKLHFSNLGKKHRSVIMNVLVGLLIVIVIVSGVSSNVLALDNVFLGSQSDSLASCSKAELEALDFLRTNASAGATVLGLSTDSNRLAYVFSGMNHLNSPYWFTINRSYQYIDITNPELALKTLYSLNITYLFATKNELETLPSNGYIASHLLKYLPIAFQNSEITIYQVPKLNPPSSDSNLTLAVPSSIFDALSSSDGPAPSNRTFYFPIDMLAESGLDYSIKIIEDGSIFNSKYIVLPSDKGWTDEQITDYLAWINNGGKLIVLNGDGLGDFAKQLAISSNSYYPFLVNKASGKSVTVELGTLPTSSVFSSDDEVKVIADYINEHNQLVPLAFSKQVGNGEILYVNLNPLFENLVSFNGTLPINFQKMGSLFNLLSLDTAIFKDIPADIRWEYLGYNATSIRDYGQIEGAVYLKSNSAIIPYYQFNAGSLKIVNITGTIDGSSVREPISQQDIIVKNLIAKGAVCSIIESQGLFLVPSNYGSYSILLLEPAFNISMQVPEGGITFSVVTSENKTYDVSLQSGMVFLDNITTDQPTTSNIFVNTALPRDINLDNQTLIFANVPSLSVSGTTYFSEAYIPNYINPINGLSVKITGTVHFKFDCSSDNFIVLTNFGYSGRFQTVQETTKVDFFKWELTAVPWANILSSPTFIIFCIFVFTVSVVIYYKTKFRSK